MDESESQGGDVFDVERILRLVELMKEHELSEVDLRQSDQRICLRRGPQQEFRSVPAAAAPPPPAAPAAAAPATAAETEGDHIVVMKSPMVGTFYRASNPKAEAFVKNGDRVIADETTVCIIEAMKVFNEIPADVTGTIVDILAENEQPVEFGSPLFKIDTSK